MFYLLIKRQNCLLISLIFVVVYVVFVLDIYNFDLLVFVSGNLFPGIIYAEGVELANHQVESGDWTFDGQSYVGYSIVPDGFPAEKALLYSPQSLWTNSLGDLYYVEADSCSIRTIQNSTQQIHTIAGYTYCISETNLPTDNIPAKQYSFPQLTRITGDTSGNLYITMKDYHVVLQVSGTNNTLRRYAGTGNSVNYTVGISAREADLNTPTGLAFSGGSLFIADIAKGGRITSVKNDNRKITSIIESMTIHVKDMFYDRTYPLLFIAADDGGVYYVDPSAPNLVCLSSPSAFIMDTIYSFQNKMFFVEETGQTVHSFTGWVQLTTELGDGQQFEGNYRNIKLIHPFGLSGNQHGDVFISQSSFISTYNIFTGMVNVSVGILPSERNQAQDNIPASMALLMNPKAITGDTLGNIYFHDGSYIRKVSSMSSHPMTVVSHDDTWNVLDINYDPNHDNLVLLNALGIFQNISLNTGDVHIITQQQESTNRFWMDSLSNIYFTTNHPQYIKKFDYSSMSSASIIAGSASGSTSSGDGDTAISARFTSLSDIWGDSNGDLFVIDNHLSIRKIYYNSIANSLYIQSITIMNYSDQFQYLSGDSIGNLYFSSDNYQVLVAIPLSEYLYDYHVLAGVSSFRSPPQPTTGIAEGLFMNPEEIWVNSMGGVFVTDSTHKIIRNFSLPRSTAQLSPSSQPSTQPSTQPTSLPTFDGYRYLSISDVIGRLPYEENTFRNNTMVNLPTSMWMDTTGNLYYLEYSLCSIRKVDATSQRVTTIIGNKVCASSSLSYTMLRNGIPANGVSYPIINGLTGHSTALFVELYFTVESLQVIMQYRSNQDEVVVYAGSGVSGSNDGSRYVASFCQPVGLWMDALRNIFVADRVCSLIRRVDSITASVTTIASIPSPTYVIGNTSDFLYISTYSNGLYTMYVNDSSSMNVLGDIPQITSVWVDNRGYVFVVSQIDNKIWSISPTGSSSVFAGDGDVVSIPSTGEIAANAVIFPRLGGIIGDARNEYLYVATEKQLVRITMSNEKIVNFVDVFNNGDGNDPLQSTLSSPIDLSGDSQGNIYILEDDGIHNQFRFVNMATNLISSFPSPFNNTLSSFQYNDHSLFALQDGNIMKFDLISRRKTVLSSINMDQIIVDNLGSHIEAFYVIKNSRRKLYYQFNDNDPDSPSSYNTTFAGFNLDSAINYDFEIVPDANIAGYGSIRDLCKVIEPSGSIILYIIDTVYIRMLYSSTFTDRPTPSTDFNVRTIVGGGDKKPSKQQSYYPGNAVALIEPNCITADSRGNVFVADVNAIYMIVKEDPSVSISSVDYLVFLCAGNGQGSTLLSPSLSNDFPLDVSISPGRMWVSPVMNELYFIDNSLDVVKKISFYPTTLFPSSAPRSLPPTSSPTSSVPSEMPISSQPSSLLSTPSSRPSSILPTSQPSSKSEEPTNCPSIHPISSNPIPTTTPTTAPSISLTTIPTRSPSKRPTVRPTLTPSGSPTRLPTLQPSIDPSLAPSTQSSSHPTSSQIIPSVSPSTTPITKSPSIAPSYVPRSFPPTDAPSGPPSLSPSIIPSFVPTVIPTSTLKPSTSFPTRADVSYLSITYQSIEANVDRSLTSFRQVNFLFGIMNLNAPAFRNIALPPLSSALGDNERNVYLLFGGKDIMKDNTLPIELSDPSTDISGLYEPIPSTQSLLSQDSSSSRSITLIADVNGDLFPDMLIGDPVSSRVYLLYGNQVGVISSLYSLEEGRGSEIVSTAFLSSGGGDGDDYLGWAVTGGNNYVSFDFNGDGLQDWAVSALSSGMVYLVYGRHSSLSRQFLLSTLSSTEQLVITGSAEVSNLGIAMSAVGDWNGDGYDDLLISSMALNSNQQGNVIFLLLGGLLTARNGRTSIDAIGKNYLVKIVSPPLSFVGLSVSWLGDVNGDGFNDLLIGSIPFRDKFLSQRSYLVLGRNLTAVKNGTISVGSLNRSMGVQEMVGGGMLVSGVGDVDDDGYSDMLIVNDRGWQGQSGSYLLRSPVHSELSRAPSLFPTISPTVVPSLLPTVSPTTEPSVTSSPTCSPTELPSEEPTIAPSGPTFAPSLRPTSPTVVPSRAPSTTRPSVIPSLSPSFSWLPTRQPSLKLGGSRTPTVRRSSSPTLSVRPSRLPSIAPTRSPSYRPGTPSLPPVSSSKPSIIPPDDDPKVTTNVTVIDRGGIVRDPPPSPQELQSGEEDKRIYLVDSASDVTILRSLPPSYSSSNANTIPSSYRVYVIKPQREMKITIKPFLATNDVLDLTRFTSFGLYSYEALSFTQSGSVITVALPGGQQILLPGIITGPSSSSPPSFPISSANFIFGAKPTEKSGIYDNFGQSASWKYYRSAAFWDSGLIWALVWMMSLFLLGGACLKYELTQREKREEEFEEFIALSREQVVLEVVDVDESKPSRDIEAPAVDRVSSISVVPESSPILVVLGGQGSDSRKENEDANDENETGDEETLSFLSGSGSESFSTLSEDNNLLEHDEDSVSVSSHSSSSSLSSSD